MPGAKKPSGTLYRLVSAGPTTDCISDVWSSAAQSARLPAWRRRGVPALGPTGEPLPDDELRFELADRLLPLRLPLSLC